MRTLFLAHGVLEYMPNDRIHHTVRQDRFSLGGRFHHRQDLVGLVLWCRQLISLHASIGMNCNDLSSELETALFHKRIEHQTPKSFFGKTVHAQQSHLQIARSAVIRLQDHLSFAHQHDVICHRVQCLLRFLRQVTLSTPANASAKLKVARPRNRNQFQKGGPNAKH